MKGQRFCFAAATMAGAVGAPCAAQGVEVVAHYFIVDRGVSAIWDEFKLPLQGTEALKPTGAISGAWTREQAEAFGEARVDGEGTLEQGPYETSWHFDVGFAVEARLGPEPPRIAEAEAVLYIDALVLEFEIEREHRLVITHEGAWRPFGVRDELLEAGRYELESSTSWIRVQADPGERLHDAVETRMVVRLIMTCRVDLTGDGELDFFDFLAFQNLFAAGEPGADFNGDGTLDFFDFLEFQVEFVAGCA